MKTTKKTILITGGNAGLGFFAAQELANSGHRVIIASRNSKKSYQAIEVILSQNQNAELDFIELDLANAESIDKAVEKLGLFENLDGLLLNAGVVFSKTEQKTADGFENQIGTNHLGHWRFISKLMPQLLTQKNPCRIVHLGSIIHRIANFPKAGLFPKKYSSTKNYAVSKFAVMVFSEELNRRLRAAGHTKIDNLVAHPGFSWDMFNKLPASNSKHKSSWLKRLVLKPIAQGKDKGAKPLVAAVTSNSYSSGDTIGPTGFLQLKGATGKVSVAKKVHDPVNGELLWKYSTELTGISPAL